jgi:hypothetical protein
MTMPPAVSGMFYRSFLGSHRENSWTFGIGTSAAYDDNIWAGSGIPLSGETYTVFPTIGLDSRTGRTTADVRYSPGFIFYDPQSELNQVTQNLSADFEYRATPRTTVTGQETFSQNSSLFNQPYSLGGAAISGSVQAASPVIIYPYGSQITDTTSANVGYQFSRNSMIGGGGSFSTYRFTNATQDAGLVDSNTYGGSAFYSLRVGRGQYVGARYSYARSSSDTYDAATNSHSAMLFYNFELGHSFSASLSGGVDYVMVTATGFPDSNTWAPSGAASFGWRGRRADVTASYARSVSTGWGLFGAYQSDSIGIAIGDQLGRKLSASIAGNYANEQDFGGFTTSSTQAGHSIFGRAGLSYSLAEHMSLSADYSRVHQNYAGIGAIAANPDADQASISFNYQFRRPLGR